MKFEEINRLALQVRNKYSELEIAKTGRPWSKSELMQGFMGDVGDLAKLVMAKDGRRTIEDVDAKLAHELSDCLWSVLVLANKFDVDLEKEFVKTMGHLNNRINKELANEC